MTIGTLQKLLKYGYKVTVIDDVINKKNSLKSYGNPLLYISNHNTEIFISAVIPKLATAKLNGRTASLKKIKQNKLIEKFIETPIKYRNYKTYNGNPDAKNSLLHLRKPEFINKKAKKAKHTTGSKSSKSYTIKNKATGRSQHKNKNSNRPKHSHKSKSKKNSYMTLNELASKLMPLKCSISVMKNQPTIINSDGNDFLGEYVITVTNIDYDVDISSIMTNYFVPASNGVNNQKALDLIYKFAKTPIKYRDYKHFHGVNPDGIHESKLLVKSVKDDNKEMKALDKELSTKDKTKKQINFDKTPKETSKLSIPPAKTISFQLTPYEREHLAKRRLSGNFGKNDVDTLHTLIALDIRRSKNN